MDKSRAEALVLHKSPHGHLAVVALKDVALIVRGNALTGSELGRRLGNERRDLAVLDAADPDAALEAGIAGLIGLGVSHVHHIVAVDVDPARHSKLFPLGD